jgi:hypothetical protein
VLRSLTAALFAAALVASALFIAGCGNSRTAVPDLSAPAAPHGFRKLTVSSAGISLNTPRNWTVTSQTAPLILTLNSGPAVVALWRLRRVAPPPASPVALRSAARLLATAVRHRDPSIAALHVTQTTVDGARALRLDAQERVAGRLRRVTSTHVYVNGAELVLDEYAPPAQFATVARDVFDPVRRSLRLIALTG